MRPVTPKDMLDNKEAMTFASEHDMGDASNVIAGEGTESAMYTKKFGRPMPSGIVCHRCGATGHIAAECTTDWDVVLRKRKANAKKQSMRPSPTSTNQAMMKVMGPRSSRLTRSGMVLLLCRNFRISCMGG